MGDRNGRMGLVAIIGTVSGMAVFFWVVSLLGRGAADGASTPSSDMLIAIPVLLVLVGGAAAWFLLTRSVANGADEDPYVACGVCSSPILREWRLCPYCGSRVEHPSLDEGSAHPAS
jgi:DNA-directed RNA polymerase subunit RPC12/RpoP